MHIFSDELFDLLIDGVTAVHNVAAELPLALAIRNQLYETLAVINMFSRDMFFESGFALHDAHWEIAAKVFSVLFFGYFVYCSFSVEWTVV